MSVCTTSFKRFYVNRFKKKPKKIKHDKRAENFYYITNRITSSAPTLGITEKSTADKRQKKSEQTMIFSIEMTCFKQVIAVIVIAVIIIRAFTIETFALAGAPVIAAEEITAYLDVYGYSVLPQTRSTLLPCG